MGPRGWILDLGVGKIWMRGISRLQVVAHYSTTPAGLLPYHARLSVDKVNHDAETRVSEDLAKIFLEVLCGLRRCFDVTVVFSRTASKRYRQWLHCCDDSVVTRWVPNKCPSTSSNAETS